MRLNAQLGEQLKLNGQTDVEAHSAAFLEVMRDKAREISDLSGFVTADQLRPIAETLGIVPHHPNLWGCLWREAGWQQVGWRKSAWPSSHRRMISVWRWVEP